MMLIRSSLTLTILVLSQQWCKVASFYKNSWWGRRSPSLQGEIGVCSAVGRDPMRPKKVNQDAYFISDNLYGILDGHGRQGQIVTAYLANELPICIQQPELSAAVELELVQEQIQRLGNYSLAYVDTLPLEHQTLIEAFHTVHWNAMQDPNVPAGRNGGTCIVASLLQDYNLHVAHVGDSRAILVRMGTVQPLTVETTVKLPAERERILNGEGSLVGSNVFYGPVGIAMTRALGDAVMLRAGVVPTPIVETFRLQDDDILVMATDGVWDVLSNQDVATIVQEQTTVQEACDEILSQATKKWIGEFAFSNEAKVDDITCLIVRI
jgi:serine/threonine protein phosphatase PrpC